MTELEPNHFKNVRSLWNSMEIHLAVESILSGKTAARMFVDDASKLKAVMTWRGHRLYLAGSLRKSGFDKTINDDYIRTGNIRQFIAYVEPAALDDAEELLADFRTRRDTRRFYSVDPSSRRWPTTPLEGYSIEPITKTLLRRKLRNTKRLEDEMMSERSSIAEFLEKSFGFAALYGEEIAGWCTSEYNVGDRCEVGIETDFGHRRKGLAKLMAGVFLDYAARIGVNHVGWHCWAKNVASVATAESLRLRLVSEYPSLRVNTS